MGQSQVEAKEILFPNGNRARLVTVSAETNPADVISALGIAPPKALIVISAGADNLNDSLKPRLNQLFSRGVARVALQLQAVIIDGGTQSGGMELMGQGVADRGRQTPLLGVAPAGRVTYPDGPDKPLLENRTPLDPNHSHFMLVDTDQWGNETKPMYDLAAAVAQTAPVVMVLVNGGNIAKQEVLRSVRQGWPVVVIQNSERLADKITKLWQEKPDFIPDPALAEIIADGDIHLFPLEGMAAGLERLLAQLVRHRAKGSTPIELAWERFARYDAHAVRQQNHFKRMQFWILALGVLGTFLALTQVTLRMFVPARDLFWPDQMLHYIIVIVPITTSLLITVVNRFSSGNKWILLRSGAEDIKCEIYRYRARAEIYSKLQTGHTSAEAKLAHKIENISRQLMQTEVNTSALSPYTDPLPPKKIIAKDDDGLSLLNPDRYVAFRLEDQLNFYQNRTIKLEKQLYRFQWFIIGAGFIGTFLAAVGLDVWIALTAALVAAFTAYLQYQQFESTLIKYNQSLTNLSNLRGWWLALSVEEQAQPQNIDKLVAHTEGIIHSEHVGWVQEMQDALTELRAGQTGEKEEPPQAMATPGEESPSH